VTPPTLGYVILYVPDVARAVEFYERAFGVPRRFVHESGSYAELETGATALAFAEETFVASTCPGFAPNRPTSASAGAEVAFVTADVPAAFRHAVASGAAPLVDPVAKPWGQVVAYVRDLNGFIVELCSPVGA
jgi:catechol 2,3-dioxygenase-like lactoylglutathione lyase family enzyme